MPQNHSSREEFTPKLWTLLKTGQLKKNLVNDILAGFIVGIVALPLAIAFAIASGVPPQAGLITAIVAGFIISALGGSRVQIGGPTGAFIVIVYGIVHVHGVGGLTVATFFAGILMIVLGIFRFGNLLKYMPYPLIVGFTSGIALIIFSSQLNDFFGLGLSEVPPEFLDKWVLFFNNLDKINIFSVIIAAGTIGISLLIPRLTNKIPGSLVAIILSTSAVYFFNIPVDTIQSRFGEIPSILSPPDFSFELPGNWKSLVQPAIAIALLGSIESLLSAVVADGMIGGMHRSNMELVAQGTANILSSVTGGIPATGAIARTATNIKNGGQTPVAGIVHSLTLLLIALVFAPLVKLIPLSALAGILVVVSYHMSEMKNFFNLLKSDRLEVIILLTTFFLTVVVDLVLAIEVGVVLSSFVFMKRMSDIVTLTTSEGKKTAKDSNVEDFSDNPRDVQKEIDKDILVYEINGPLFFGAAHKFLYALKGVTVAPKVVMIGMEQVPFIDSTGMYRLKETIQMLQKRKVKVVLYGVKPDVFKQFKKESIDKMVGIESIVKGVQN